MSAVGSDTQMKKYFHVKYLTDAGRDGQVVRASVYSLKRFLSELKCGFTVTFSFIRPPLYSMKPLKSLCLTFWPLVILPLFFSFNDTFFSGDEIRAVTGGNRVTSRGTETLSLALKQQTFGVPVG